MNLEGKILGNRYLLIEEIGGGGMSVVYKAQCSLLQRFVAVKILRQEFTHDKEIVQRFKFEAQSAAKLQHPNIVAIYDVGEENGYQYIVMEYVDGITLKQAIERKGRLVWDEALDYSIQIAAALEQAHKNKIIHRDIKPHNIMINDQGVAKVTDFGIARATNTSSTLTNLGNAIGSVHYFSPEQAQGVAVDERSDLYSLGITLYEMLTGVVPFNADSPISVALKHINDPVNPPIERIPSLPKGINQLVMKSIRKDPKQRYQSAREMIEDMYLLMKSPESMLSEEDVKDKTKRFNGAVIPEPLSDERLRKKRRRNNIILFSSVILGGALLMIIAFLVVASWFKPVVGLEYVVKNYVNQKLELVKAELPSWVKIDTIDITSDTVPAGTIISQNPTEGEVIKEKGLPLELTVSTGVDVIKIPDFSDKNNVLYTDELTNLGLKFILKSVFDETVPKDNIVKVEPGFDTEVKVDSTVTVYVSKGPEAVKFKMPKLVGMKYSDAVKLMNKNGLKVGIVTPNGTSINNFYVLTQLPKEGDEVIKGDKIDLTLDPYVTKTYTLDLSADGFVFPLTLSIDSIPSDTGVATRLIEGSYLKKDFPLTINTIKVPVNGDSTINVYVNGDLYKTDSVTP